MELSRCSYSILAILQKNNMTSKARGFTIDEIMEREKLSKRTTIHKKVKELQRYGYVDEGAKAARAKTYYITDVILQDVQNPEQFANELVYVTKKYPKVQNAMQAVTVDRLNGGSKLGVNRIL